MEKVLYCFYEILLKIRADLNRHSCVYRLSSKHTYRPMRTRVVAQLFYKLIYKTFSTLPLLFTLNYFSFESIMFLTGVDLHLFEATCTRFKLHP